MKVVFHSAIVSLFQLVVETTSWEEGQMLFIILEFGE